LIVCVRICIACFISFELVLNPILNLIEDSASLKDLPKARKT